MAVKAEERCGRSTHEISMGGYAVKDFTITCPRCKGSGKDPQQKMGFSVCPTCKGTGTIKKG
jgi:DnaJ-class molecular chaperone